MPARLNTQTRVVQGNRTIILGTDEGWRFGPVEGRWYIGMMVFAVVVLLYNLALPWAYETATGRSWRFSQSTPVATQTTAVGSQPTATQQAMPSAISPSVPADPTDGMSPEDKRLYERLVLRK